MLMSRKYVGATVALVAGSMLAIGLILLGSFTYSIFKPLPRIAPILPQGWSTIVDVPVDSGLYYIHYDYLGLTGIIVYAVPKNNLAASTMMFVPAKP